MIDKNRPRLQCIRGLFFTITSNYTLSEEEFINYIKFLRPLWGHDPESKFEKCDLYLFGPTNDFFAKKLARDRPPLAKTLS